MRLKEIHLVAAFLTALLTFFSRPAPAEDLRMIWADYEKEGNPVYLSRSGEDGWETSVFPPSVSLSANYAPCLGIAPDGTSWVIWAGQAADSFPGIYYSRNQGGSWSEPRRVDEGSDRWESTPAIAFDQAGNPLVVWSGVEGGSTEIFCAGWAGDGFGPAVMVSTPDDSPDSSPSIAADGEGSLLVVWEGWSGGFSQVFKSRLTGGEWTPEEMVDPRPGSDQILPAARETGEGRLNVTWREDGETVALENGRRKDSPDLRGVIPVAGLPSPGRSAWLLSKNGNGSWGIYRYRTLFPASKYTTVINRPRRSAATDYYIGYGDSITYGHSYGSDTSGWYGSLLAAMLPQNIYFYNRGYPAAETEDLLNGPGHPDYPCPGINSVISSLPAATKILIMGGTNDVNHGEPYPNTKYYLGQMVDRARAKGVEPLLGTIIPSNKSDGAFVGSWQLSTYYIPPLADEKSCLLANPYEQYMYYYNSNRPYYWSLYEDDGVHPEWSEGDRQIANAWYALFITPTPTSSPSPSPTPTPANLVLDSGDYDGDSTSDIAVFRQSSGLWAVKGVTRVYFGTGSDTPAPGDFDGDGRTDLALFRPASGLWAVRGITRAYFGRSGDIPAPGDYDGNGTC
ncbi:MAG: GDSL-type esterase/lipase family protein, partial [PVC group bacterium]